MQGVGIRVVGFFASRDTGLPPDILATLHGISHQRSMCIFRSKWFASLWVTCVVSQLLPLLSIAEPQSKVAEDRQSGVAGDWYC